MSNENKATYNNQNCYAEYENLPTNILELILRQDCLENGGDNALDLDTILYITEVLAERKRNSDNPGKTPKEALKDFQRRMEQEEYADYTTNSRGRKRSFFHSNYLKRSLATAAIVLFITGAVATNAFGTDLWRSLYIWAEETFEFTKPGTHEMDSSNELDLVENLSYHQLIQQYEIPKEMMPSAMPDGFIQTSTYISENYSSFTSILSFQDGDRWMRVMINRYGDKAAYKQEKIDDYFDSVLINGITYYITSNENQFRLTWQNQNFECYISGDITIEEIYLMLDSVGG